MLSAAKEFFTGYDTVAGLEVCVKGPEDFQLYLIVLNRRKNSLELRKKQVYKSFTELFEELPSGSAVALTITGKGVISKTGERRSGIKDLFPQLSEDQIYYELILCGEKKVFRMIRREAAGNILDKLLSNGMFPIQLNIGSGIATSLLQALNSNEVITTDCIYSANEGTVTSISPSGKSLNYRIGEDEVDNKFLPAYGAAFDIYTGTGLTEKENIPDKVKTSISEFSSKKLFKRGGVAALTAAGVLVFVNLFMFLSFSSSRDELQAKYAGTAGIVEKVEDLQKDISTKEGFLKQAGWFSPSKTSFYADRIAASVPKEIRLDGLHIFPVDEKAGKREKKLIVENNRIILTGTCTNPVSLNPFMQELLQVEGIKSASSKDYYYDHKRKTGVFRLELTTGI